MREVNLEDPIKLTLNNIIELTSSMVKFLRREGRKKGAKQLILYVATCLHNILIRKQEHYITNPFTPEWVRARYYAKRTKANHKQGVKRKSRENPYITRQRVLRSYIKFQTKVAQRQSICMVKEWDCPDLITSEEFKIQYLDPLERAVDSFLSAAVYWKESNLITEEELAETQSLWQRVILYIKNL